MALPQLPELGGDYRSDRASFFQALGFAFMFRLARDQNTAEGIVLSGRLA